ncbi:MAG TPA: TraB/GumN family protein [Steroidobacteraceae bacterium]|nr:TraB/GumN family protein [Steroidobacteraceae bacterium]
MRRRTRAAAALLPLLAALSGATEPAAQQLDEIVVHGEQPGPAMWKISRDGHAMWIMGTLTPVPAQMTWRSKEAEQVIAQSGEILGSTSARPSADIGLFGALKLIPSLLRARNNPDGATLRQALPAEVYGRWSAMYRRVYGKDADAKDKTRPLFAADQLYRRALQQSGLTGANPVWPTVQKLAKQYKVHIRERQFQVPLQDPQGLIADLAKIPRDKEVACLVKTLDYIDVELPNIRRRAAAWATGDLDTLRALPVPVSRNDCFNALLDALRPRMENQVKQVAGEMAADRSGIFSWMLLAHPVSFTTMPIERLLREDDLIAGWRAAGYTVEEPH